MKFKRYTIAIICLVLIMSSMLLFNVFAANPTPVSISISYLSQDIPSSTTLLSTGVVSSGIPAYKVKVRAYVSGTGYDIIGKNLTFSNPNSSSVRLISSTSVYYTGTFYAAEASYEVRGTTQFTCSASINDGSFSGSGSKSITPQTACYYYEDFLITYYIIASEDDYTGTYSTSAPGISGLYKSAFLADVKVQGSGYTHNNEYIQYSTSTSKFSVVSYPKTATGTSPTAGKTIAVDPYYIPRLSTQRAKVNIGGGVGDRQAEDGGGAILNWHIDVFMGTGKSSGSSAEGTWNMTDQSVYYYGNNLW